MATRLHENLQGQVALVSGANRGIGAAIATGLAARGATVYAATRRLPAIRETDGILPIELDVTDDPSISAAIRRIERERNRLDILVNNAAVYDDAHGDLVVESAGELDRVLAVNLRGPILLTKAALPLLLRKRGSRVVNVSSGSGSLSDGVDRDAPAYGISKAGLNALTSYLHGAYSGKGLIANSVCPGWVRTDMGGPRAPRSVKKGAETPIWLAMFAPGSPSGHFWRDRKIIPW